MKPHFFSAASLLLFAALAAAQSASSARAPTDKTSTVARASAGVLGNWHTVAGSIVRIDRCGPNVCLWLVQLAPGIPSTDIRNTDPAQRSRPLCGLEIGSGFKLADPNHASGGTLYDPKSGKTYRGTMTATGTAAGAQLHLRGYVGIPLFGASETWTRPSQPIQPCNANK